MKRCLIILACATVWANPTWADVSLATSKNCMACHTVERKRVGPAFKDIAKKYQAQSDAAPYLARKIMHGSRGVWGAVPMPANNQINEDDAQKLAQWVLSLP